MKINNFEWDDNKRETNLKKHGIDFVDVIEIFNDINRIEMEIVQNGEKRFQTIGMIYDIVILLVYTWRGEKIRIISARRASKKERNVYHSLRF